MTTRVTYDHQVTYDHRQVGQAGKSGDAPKETWLNFVQSYFKRPKRTKLS